MKNTQTQQTITDAGNAPRGLSEQAVTHDQPPHSPLPWATKRISVRYGCYGWEITRREPRSNQPLQPHEWDRRLAFLDCDDDETRANAKLIINAVNNADKLVEALRMWLDGSGKDPVATSRAALSAYEGSAQ